jgi:anaerobic magnesium-protoporphyrin IX monomethyl ester cyclase
MKKDFRILLLYPNEPLVGVAPSNLAILSACLKKDGFDVKLFDCTLYLPKEEIQDQTRSKFGQVKKTDIENYIEWKKEDIHEDFIRVVKEYKPNLIGINVIDSTIRFALSFLEKIKDKKIPIITGGVGSTFNSEKILNTDLVNFVCEGEGEEALVELSNALYKNEDCSKIKNLCFKNKEGKIIKNTKRPLVNLDNLPIPDFSIYEYSRFYRPFMGKVVRQAQIDIDRGCPFSCTYCAAPSLKRTFKEEGCGAYYRIKSLDKIFEEIKFIVKEYDINFLWISSETLLALPLEKFKKFANRYIDEIHLPFWSRNRLDMFSDEKTKLLAEMGCQGVSVGLEHGSEKIRKQLLNKQISNETIIESIKTLAKYNIAPTLNNMIGLPDETRENIFETIELNRQITSILKGNHTLNVFTFIPFSGTSLKDLCIRKGYISENNEIPFSFHKKSILNMPSLNKDEIYGLEKTLTLYILLPKSYWPDIKIAEKEDRKGIRMYEKLMNILKEEKEKQKEELYEKNDISGY